MNISLVSQSLCLATAAIRLCKDCGQRYFQLIKEENYLNVTLTSTLRSILFKHWRRQNITSTCFPSNR